MRARFVSLLVLVLAAVAAMVATRLAPPHAGVLAEPALPRELPAATAIEDAPDDLEALRRRIATVLEREQVPGVGIALVDRSGVIWAGGVGVADVQTQAPVQADTAFRVASISKSIVGLGVARLHARGRLDLDAPLSDTLPELAIANPWSAEDPVTLAHALEHTAGFDDMRFNEWFAEDDAMAPADALAINPASHAVRWRPGSRMSYSNVGWTIGALAIERAAGRPFDAWLHAEILAPLGMDRAAFTRTPDLAGRLATGYRAPEAPLPYRSIAHRGAGALLASPADLGRLVHFWLRRGDGFPSIVPASMLDRIERASTLRLRPGAVEYGLGNYGDVAHPVVGRGHDGGLPGFASCFRYFPTEGVGYVMLLNASHSAAAYVEIRQLLFAWLVRGRVLPDPPPPVPDAELPSGFFAYASPRHELLGFLERALLGWRVEAAPTRGIRLSPLLGSPVDLVATPDGGFRHPLQSGTSVRFGTDAEGRPAMAAAFAYAEGSSYSAALARLWLLRAASWLLDASPLYALSFVLVRRLRRRSMRGAGLVVWPAVASLSRSCAALSFMYALRHDELGDVTASTIAVCACTLAFALSSARAFVSSLAWALKRDRPGALVAIVPSSASVLAFGLALWLGAHGIIGLRTWAW